MKALWSCVCCRNLFGDEALPAEVLSERQKEQLLRKLDPLFEPVLGPVYLASTLVLVSCSANCFEAHLRESISLQFVDGLKEPFQEAYNDTVQKVKWTAGAALLTAAVVGGIFGFAIGRQVNGGSGKGRL